MKLSRARLALAGLTLAAIGAATFSGGDEGSRADRQQAAQIALRSIRDIGSHDWADFCTLFTPGRHLMWNSFDRCVSLFQAGTTAPDFAKVAAISSSLTVDLKQVRITGDTATVPVSAIQYDGTPLTDMTSELNDLPLIRFKGQWYIEHE